MAYELSIQESFGAAHNLREYNGKCERLHGHNFRVDLHVAGDRLNDEGMLIDFVALRRILHEVVDRFDHQYLNEVPPFDRLNPTSENLARIIAEEVAAKLPPGIRVDHVTTWESERSGATYRTKGD
jgi:6-pyruvoyltetrahydropterin/6-carboxytetrahydropterin synthase